MAQNRIHPENMVKAGKSLKEAAGVLIMIHGRGGTAEDILSLTSLLDVNDFSFLAPQASNNSWYPYTFLAPPPTNEPWLTGSLSLLKELVNNINKQAIASENIYFLGFSQGACLILEFVARNAFHYGGVVAFTGGLIGDRIYTENYKGDFKKTPIFIASSDPDPHIPVTRVHASTKVLKEMNAEVTEKIYENMGHTISQDEIKLANQLVFKK